MKITDVKLYRISIPLRVPFKTALRSVDSVEDVIVEIITDTGERGFGEAPPTGVITGYIPGLSAENGSLMGANAMIGCSWPSWWACASSAAVSASSRSPA